MTGGRISVLVSRDFQLLLQVAREVPREVAARIRAQTRVQARPILVDEMRERVGTRLESRVLLDTARVSVSDSNVLLKTATVGEVHGAASGVLAPGTEFGASPDRKVKQRSRKGKTYTRRLGPVFRAPRRRGYVFFPSVQAVIPRMGALWWQTTYKAVADMFDKVAR